MKKVLLALLSVFFLVGGVVFSACNEQKPQAVINVVSSDFVSEDYIEIDLTSDKPYAQLTATVENVSYGQVDANTSSDSILTTSTQFNSNANSTQITIYGESEGRGIVELKSAEGSASKIINVFVYSNILGVEQKDASLNKNQYVIRGEENFLDPGRYLDFTSRPNGESNRKDVTWEFAENQSQLDLVLQNGYLTIDEEYVGDSVKLVARSVYTDLFANVTLNVIDRFDAPTLTFSREGLSGYEVYETPFNLIKNDEAQEEAKLYVKLDFNDLDQSELVTSWQVYSNGVNVADVLDITRQGSDTNGNPYYLIRAKSADLSVQTLSVNCVVSYKDINYSQTGSPFELNLVDVVDRISVTSNGENVLQASEWDIYNNYSSDMPYGRPFQVVLGPNTVEGAEFKITSSENLGNLFRVYYQTAGAELQQITFIETNGEFESESIPNNAIVYFEAKSGSGETATVEFVSTQSENIKVSFNLTTKEAPNGDFNITSETDFYLSTLEEERSISSELKLSGTTNISQIFDGLYYEIENLTGEAKISVSLQLSGDTATITVTNNEENITDNYTIRICHKSGFKSNNTINVSAFTPLTNASVGLYGANSNSVVEIENGYQDDDVLAHDYTLTKLVMRSSNSVSLNLSLNQGATLQGDRQTFAFYRFADGVENLNVSTYADLQSEIANGNLVGCNDVTFDFITNRLTVEDDVKGYAVFVFSGYNEDHGNHNLQRLFYLEGYTGPTSLRANPSSVSLVARDSISLNDFSLSTQNIEVRYRLDNIGITYFDISKFDFSSSIDANAQLTGDEPNLNYKIENITTTETELKFDIVALTTFDKSTFSDTLIIEYSDFGSLKYYAEIDINITSATRVQNLVWENQTENGEIHLELYSANQSDKQFTIITSVAPLDAYNRDLTYIFVPGDSTPSNLIEINNLGIVTFESSLNRGGTGTIYVLPTDAIRLIGGSEYIVYYQDGQTSSTEILLSELQNNYESVTNGYFLVGDGEKIYYRDVILSIPIVVADGRSEATATRIYTAEQFKAIDVNLHYVLMNSITLDEYDNAGKAFAGSLKGYDENVAIYVSGDPLFDKIVEGGKVSQLTVYGDVTGGGFIANENDGEVSNVVITTQNSGETISMSKVTSGYELEGSLFGGAIVGVNNNTIKDVKIEGVKIELASIDTVISYAGTFVGKNTGAIENVYGEFYVFNDGINTITANYVGGFVGYAESGSITHSYVYNYTASWDTDGNLTFEEEGCLIGDAGAFVGYSTNNTIITNSFSMVIDSDTVYVDGSISSSSTNYYYGNYSAPTSSFDREYWLEDGDEGFKSYVRNGQPHLKFYQDEVLVNLSGVAVKKTSKSLPVENVESEGKGILFFHRLTNTANLSDASNTALTRLNTISFDELFGEENIVVVSSNNQIVEVVGKNIVIKNVGDVTLTVSNKHNYAQSKPFEFKVMYVLEDFSGFHNGIETSGFDLQEGKSDYVEFRIKENVYLANEAQPRDIYLPNFTLKGSFSPASDLVSYEINGMVGQVSFGNGIKEALNNLESQSVTLSTSISVSGLSEEYSNALSDEFTNTLNVVPFLGADEILTYVDSVRIEPAVKSSITVDLLTDSDEDALILQIVRKEDNQMLTFDINGTNTNSLIIDASSKKAKAKYVENILNVDVSRKDFENSKYNFVITLSINEDYRSKIEKDEEYTLILTSESGTAKNEGKTIDITLSSQQINFVDITNYRASNVNNISGQIVYTRTDEQVSVISPGRASFMSIVVDPAYSYYHHMTLTYEAIDAVSQQASNAVLTLTNLKKYNGSNSQYVVNSGSATNVVGGLQIARNNDGIYDFRLYASQNISSDVIFILKATFYDANNDQIGDSTTYRLYVTYLPEAEIMVDGEVSTVLAKGGTAELSIRLKQDQDIDYLTAVGATGITISPRSSWEETQNPDGTKTLTATLYASLNAGIGTTGENGTFEIQASVVRQLNGVEERKNSNAYVTIVDIEPTSAKLNGAVYDEASNTYVFTSWVGITHGLKFDYDFDPENYSYDESNETESNLVNELNTARANFEKNGYYFEDDSVFSINYRDSQAVPIYQRLEMNGTRLTFTKDNNENYTYSNGRFRLTYSEDEGLSVTGIGTTSSPIYLTLIDEIRIASEGDALYQIETNFAINVTIYSDLDRPLIIQTAEDFLQVAQEEVAQDYILLNDITLENYTPISSANFESLDGNGYSINIKSFNLQGAGSLQLGLFTTVTENSIIKNVRVNYYQTSIAVDVTSSGYSNINIGGLAVVNNGTITNCQVVSYNPNGEDATNLGLQVNYFRASTPYYIDANSNIESRVAGFVVENSGSITNSKVGGSDIILIGEQVGTTNYFDYSVRELSLFELSGQGNVAGFVVSNSGEIASSGASNIQIDNLSSSDLSQTAGFVVTNSGKIRASAIQGITGDEDLKDGYARYHRTGSSISSKGIVAGFVVENSQNGEISDGYSNILISNSQNENSLVGAGFVYINAGYIETSYTASMVEPNNAHQLNFSGFDNVGNSLNTGTIELSYYYTVKQEFDSSSDVQATLNEASIINKEEVGNQNAYYGFVFNTEEGVDDGVWKMVDGYGIEPISLTQRTISHRYYVASEIEEEYFLPYSILMNQSDSLAQVYDTSSGEEINPILINSAQDLKEAMGDSTSTSLSSQFTETEILGAYRFTTDIDLSELNNALGNAEIKSVNKTFKGIIDGNGFTIENISLSSDENSVGLFGSADGALIQNLNIEIDSVAAGSSVLVGGLIGLAKDTKIININMTQNETTEQTQQRGIFGRNVTGGIVGAAIGNGALVGLTVSGATVQSNYYNEETKTAAGSLYTHQNADNEWVFDPAKIRGYANQNDGRIYSTIPSDSGFGLASFAGAVAGYVDIYDSALINQENYTYSTALTNDDYKVTHLRVIDSLEVRGEVVGGAIGYTGIQTKVQDAGVYVSRGENITAKILSYNFIAGGLVGIANGDFYQVFTQHDEELQDEIENSMASYYLNGNANAERGILDVFENTSTATDAYQPLYVGGLFGVFGNGSVYVGYSKLNAINPNASYEGYAGGLAGGAFSTSGTDFVVEDVATSSMISTTMILREVYVSGDVYANGPNSNGTASNFGGLFGRFIPYNNDDSQVKLTMAAVNAFNEYGILSDCYKSTSTNKISTINSVVGEGNNVKPVVSQVISTTENSDNRKSYGYMGNYSSGTTSVEVKSGNYKDDSTGNADFVFEVQSLSTFANPESGYMITNGAFINSNAWDVENWIHTTDKLFPSINLTSSPTYIYLDQDNVAEVLNKMQNSSIEVRVRGRGVDANGDVYYAYVDLRPYASEAVAQNSFVTNFFGRLIGATDSAWFSESNGATRPYEANGLTSNTALNNSYPGIVIDRAMFETVGTGVVFQNLNVVFNGSGEDPKIKNSFIENSIKDVDFTNVRFWYLNEVEISGADKIGLIAPSAENCNFIGITMCFSATSTSVEDAIVTFKPSSSNISAGLLVGELVQSSTFETLRLQNITIKHNDLLNKYLLKITEPTQSSQTTETSKTKDVYAGLYVGNIKNGNMDEGVSPSGVSISAKLPQNITSTLEPGDGTDTVFNSGISVVDATTDTYDSVYIGGLFGSIDTVSTTFTLQKQTSYSQSVKVNVNVNSFNSENSSNTENSSNSLIGGVVGNFNGEFNVVADGENTQIGSDIVLDVKHDELSAGMIFGDVATGSRIDISTNKQLKIEGYISVNGTGNITTANLGSVVGVNNGTLNISNVDISFKTFKGNTPGEISEKDFEASAVKDNLFTATTINAGALVGLNNSGTITIEGKDDSTDPNNASFKVNTAQENILLDATTINAGGLIGKTTGSGVVSISNYINNQAVIVAVGKAGSGATRVGGMIGFGQVQTSQVQTSQDKPLIDIKNSASDVNIFVSEKTLYAGGLIGQITTTETNQTTTTRDDVSISQNVFSGAIKVYGATSNEGVHNIGGLIGSIEKDGDKANIKTTISSNKTYGDVIYTTEATVTTGEATTTKETTFNSLNDYYFGGIVGYVNAGSTTLSGNIVAFTNNNQLRGGGLHFADAMVGNDVSESVEYDERNSNYYSSQLVLATSDNAIDLNYNAEGVSGYSPNDATTTTTGTIIGMLTAQEVSDAPSVEVGGFGTKLNPITDGTAKTSSSNGITYYTTQYPDPETQSDPYAFIGDWVEKANTLTTLNEHSFISGVNTNLNFEDTVEDKKVNTNDTNRGGIVNTMNGGIVYACISAGTLSVGGNVTANVGGIVGSMVSGYINESSSSLNVTYRAGNGGTASAVAVVLAGNAKKIFINNTYTSGNVTSYIDANLYAFINGTDSTNISNSYTISRVSWNDYTSDNIVNSNAVSIGITGNAVTTNFGYDPDAMGDAYEEGTERIKDPDNSTHTTSSFGENSNWIYPAYYNTDGNSTGTITISGWSKNAAINYGYPVRNFAAFKAFKTQETNSDVTYELIPNVTKLVQAKTTDKNYKLTDDIDFAKTTYNTTDDDGAISASDSPWSSLNFSSVQNFDGGEHTISNLRGVTLFDTVQNISNLRVMDAELTNQRAVVALEVTGTASNVIASGTLRYSRTLTADKYIGGVFAYATGDITGCKNYVKMDVTCDGIDIGGVVGKSTGTSITNCFNYAPINAVNKNANGGGGYVAGIVGSWSAKTENTTEEITVKNCGNENTVFNGYTITDSGIKDQEKDNFWTNKSGNYSAAGIVGWTNTAGSISNCYNTSMIKAGHKKINKTSGSSKAAGIVASTTGSVSNCTNTGFIEALGSTEALKNPESTKFKIADDSITSWTKAGTPLAYTIVNQTGQEGQQGFQYEINADDIKNVYVSQIGILDSNDEVASGDSSATGSIYKNGLFGTVTGSVSETSNSGGRLQAPYVPTYEPGVGNNETISLHNGDIKIYFAEETSRPTPVIAETDELGAMTKFYIKSTRTIKYVDSLSYTQTRYWSVVDINGLHTEGASYSANQNYYAQRATIGNGVYNGTGYTEPELSTTNTSSSDSAQNVTISGNTYAFVEGINGFITSVNNQTKTEEFDVTGDIGGKSISELVKKGYKFNVVLVEYGENISNAWGDVSVVDDGNGGKKLSISIKYVPVKDSTGYADVKYTITASKDDETIEQYLDASTLFFEKGETKAQDTVKIYYNDSNNELVAGGSYNINKIKFSYTEGTDGALSYFFYTGNDAEGIYNALKDKESVSIIINEGETIDATQNIVLNDETNINNLNANEETIYTDGIVVISNNLLYYEKGSYKKTNNQNEVEFKLKGKIKSFDAHVGDKYDQLLTGIRGNYTIENITYEQKGEQEVRWGALNRKATMIIKATYDEDTNITTITIEMDTSADIGDPEYNDLSCNEYEFSFENFEGEDDFATYSYTTNTSGEKQLNVNVKKDVGPSLVIVDGKAKAIMPNSENRTLTFDGEVASISKIGIRQAEWEDAVTFNDSNSDGYVDQIVFTIKEDYLAIYTVNDITKSISSTATDRKLVFDLDDNLTSLTITRKALLYNSSSSITYEDEGIVKVDGKPATATVYTLHPVLYKVTYDEEGNIDNFTNVEINAENTFVLNGITYTATLDSENLIITSVSQGGQDYTTIFPESLINLNGKLYYYSLTQTGGTRQMSLLEAYLGEGGIINVDGTDFIYEIYGEPDNYQTYLYDSSLNPISEDEGTGSFIINSSTFVLDECLKESVTVEPSVEDGKLTVTAPENSTFDSFSVIELNYQAKAPSVNIVLPIENNTYTLETDNYVNEITYTINDETAVTSSPTNITFGPYLQGSQIEITKKYNEYSNNEATEKVGLTSSSTSYYSGIVLTKDITIGTLSEDLALNYNLAGNRKIINFVRRSNAKNSLFNSITANIFIKDVSIAGSLIYPEENTGIIAKTISSSLINTNVYGTIDLNASRTCGGVAYEINSNPTKLKSYVSISHDTSNVTSRGSDNNVTGNMAGVAWEMSGGTNIEYYGTIIGTNGSHGTTYNNDGTKNGGKGQDVYALAHTISSTRTNFNFYGTIKSGDGGSGSRGLDGKGGTDGWAGASIGRDGTSRENIRHLNLGYADSYEYLGDVNNDPGYHNPTKGTNGNPGGGEGAHGGVFEYENSSNNLQDEPATFVENNESNIGKDGNNGWIGVNMLQYADFRHWDYKPPIMYDLNTITNVINNSGEEETVWLNIKFDGDLKGDSINFDIDDNVWVGITFNIAGDTYGLNSTIFVDHNLSTNMLGGKINVERVDNRGYILGNKILVLAYRYSKHTESIFGDWIRAKDCEKRFIVVDKPVSAEFYD